MSIEIQRRLLAIMRQSQRKDKDQISLRITICPTILNRLREEDEELLLKLQEQFNGRLNFRADPAYHMEDISIVNAETNEDLFNNRQRQ